MSYKRTSPQPVIEGGTGAQTLTSHGILLGQGTSAITATAAGGANTVLLGQGAADPIFGTVPNAALTSSSVTLNNGNNITVTGSPLSLGGTASFNLTGTTDHAIQLGNAGGSLSSLGVGASGTVLTGVSASDPAFSATPTVTSMTVTASPLAGTDAANKSYVDSVASGFTFEPSTVAATTADLGPVIYFNGAAGVGATLTNNGAQAAFSVDGVSPAHLDRVLVKDQADQTQNGIYDLTTVGSGASNWVLTRSTNYDDPTEIKPGTVVPVTSGTLNAGTTWLETATVTAVGTDPIIFSRFTGASLATFHTDSGNATVSGSAITMAGGSNINTSGAGSTITYNLNASPSIAGTLTAGTGLVATTGNITASGGNVTASALVSAGTSMSAGTTITAGTGLIATTGGLTLSSFTEGALVTSSAGVASAVTGTAGFVLTANAPGSAPSFQASPSSSISITGNTGGDLVGNAFTFSGGATGLSFGGAGSTETLTFAGITANGGTVSLATDATNSTINVGTGAGIKTTTLGSTNTSSITTINAGSGAINLSSTAGTNLRTIAAGYTGSNWITLQEDVQTTDATPTNLLDVPVADSQMISIKGYINGFRSTFASSIGAEVFFTVQRSAGGNVAIVGTPIVNTNTNSTADVVCIVDTGAQTAIIQVVGVAATTWNWVGTFEYMYLNSNA